MDVSPQACHGRRSEATDASAGSSLGPDAGAQRFRGQQSADHRSTLVPPCPAVAFYGRAIIKSLVA
eukprot:812109-Lingulodinium_polyedra.AAC.1